MAIYILLGGSNHILFVVGDQIWNFSCSIFSETVSKYTY